MFLAYDVRIITHINGNAQEVASITGDAEFVAHWMASMAETILGGLRESAREPNAGTELIGRRGSVEN